MDMDNCYTIEQSIELRRARWLEKLAHMGLDRGPRNLLQAWTPKSRPCSKPKMSTKRSLAKTLKKLELETKMNDWITIAKNTKQWGKHIEETCNKAFKILGLLKRNLSSCPQKVKMLAYKALIRPILEYASAVWDPHQEAVLGWW